MFRGWPARVTTSGRVRHYRCNGELADEIACGGCNSVGIRPMKPLERRIHIVCMRHLSTCSCTRQIRSRPSLSRDPTNRIEARQRHGDPGRIQRDFAFRQHARLDSVTDTPVMNRADKVGEHNQIVLDGR